MNVDVDGEANPLLLVQKFKYQFSALAMSGPHFLNTWTKKKITIISKRIHLINK